MPDTDRPKIGSGESILWPPAREIPACLHISRPPSITFAPTSVESILMGHPKIEMAIKGLPPIA